MSAPIRFAHRCIDLAARRWPAELRDELAAEWHAELAAAESGRQALGFALSLLMSPPLKDRSGAPRGWAETTGALTPAAALVVTGMLTIGVAQVAEMLTGMIGIDSYATTWSATLASGLLTALWCVLAGRWLGRRMPLEGGTRFAPLLLVPAILAPTFAEMDATYLTGQLIGLAIWVPGMIFIGRGRPAVVLATPLVGALAAVAATVPMIVSDGGDLHGMVASLLVREPPAEYMVIEDGLSSRAFYYLGPWAVTLCTFGLLAWAYTKSSLKPLPRRMTAVAIDGPRTLPPLVVSVGVGCVALSVIAWAYTLAILSPAMPGVSATAPMPGGDGEIYLWVAELRWTAIILTVLGLVIAVADRRRVLPAAAVLGVLLFAANGVLVRLGVAGAGGLRVALVAGAVAVGLSWIIAGTALSSDYAARVIRRRVTTGAMIAGACGPLILTQGTPGVNHPFLPAGLTITTTGLAVLGVLLALIPAVVVSGRTRAAWLIALPLAVALVAGLAPVDPGVEDSGYALLGGLIGVPLSVVVLGLMRGRRVIRWGLLTVAAVPLSAVLWYGAIFVAGMVPDLLFASEGLGYPADGLSAVPGAVLLMLPFAALASTRPDPAPSPAPLAPLAPVPS
ncbi:hypothetical protein [Actinoplanes sp. NPDC051851]|uniref:hypothetical protein n=1 Tax=Actinoplanes sp. NPDC051851 TaxID=3154753 RepID=UPI00343F7A15